MCCDSVKIYPRFVWKRKKHTEPAGAGRARLKRKPINALWMTSAKKNRKKTTVISLQPTFCLSRIFMAKYCSVPLCFTSMTLPNEPVPSVFNLSKSSRHVVLCGRDNPLACPVQAGWTPNIDFWSVLLVEGIPTSVRSLLWLWRETLSLEGKGKKTQTLIGARLEVRVWSKYRVVLAVLGLGLNWQRVQMSSNQVGINEEFQEGKTKTTTGG